MIVKSREGLPPDIGPWPNLAYQVGGFQSKCSTDPVDWSEASALHISKIKNSLYRKIVQTTPYPGNERFTSTENKRPVYNNCTHTKIQQFNYAHFTHASKKDCESCSIYTPYWGQYSVGNRLNYPSVSFADSSFFADLDFDPSLLGELANAQRNAWHAMQPRFEGQVQLLNSLFELKDFRSVFRSFYRVAQPSKILNKLRYGVPRSKNLDLSKPAAGLFLTNALAIQPLLNDVAKIMQQITTIVEEAQTAFDVAGADRQKSHYTHVMSSDETITSRTAAWNYDSLLGRFDKLEFTATMEYTYEYRLRGLVDAFKQYWGLELDYEALWNAVPFSFILDYFSTLGKSIHNMEHDKNVNLAYSQYCESLLRTKTSGYVVTKPTYQHTCSTGTLKVYVDKKGFADSQSGIVLNDSARVPISGYSGSNYRRWVREPNKGAALPFFKKPSSHQGLVMASLIRSFF